MLTLKNIGITYENGKVAVSDFNLDIKKGEIIGIGTEAGYWSKENPLSLKVL